MTGALLVAGIGALLAGLLAIGFGIPVKEFSFGNTLIVTGVIGACTGMVMLGLWMLVRALNSIAQRLGPEVSSSLRAGATPLPASEGATLGDGGFLFRGDRSQPEDAGYTDPSALPPWQEEVAGRYRLRRDAPPESEPVDAAPAVKPRRNLLFSSSSRRERERAQARTPDPSTADPAAAPPASESDELPPATFDDAWPKSDRSRAPDAPPRHSGRTLSTFTEAPPVATGEDRYQPAPRNEEQPPVTVLKSGVVDGMAYSLYSDGSIEAQMPEGMMRFASIDELRAHLDHRP
jgi:hypothetical protein